MAEKSRIERVFAATKRAPQAVKDLATALGGNITPQAVVADLKKLEAAGAVSKDPDGGWSRMPGVRKFPEELRPAPEAKPAKPAKDEAPAEAPKRGRRRTTRVEYADGAVVEASVPEAGGTGPVSLVEASNVVEGPWGTPEGVEAPEGSVDAVLADLQATRPVSAPPATPARRARVPREPREAGGPRWRAGQLAEAIEAQLVAKPDGTFSPSEMAAAVNAARTAEQPEAQVSSVGFGLEVLVKRGTARRTEDARRRYAALVA